MTKARAVLAVNDERKPVSLRFFLLPICVFISANAMALGIDDQGGLTQTLLRYLGFAPDQNLDLSYRFLGQIFGSVGSVLMASENQLISSSFRLFNLGILTIAGSMIGYATAMSVVHTAGQGVALGKKMGRSFAFIVTRQVAAVSLLLPQFNGYSALQVLIMSIVIKGVHLANFTWYWVSDYSQKNGSIVHSVINQQAYNSTLSSMMGQKDQTFLNSSGKQLGDAQSVYEMMQQAKILTNDQISTSQVKVVWSDLYKRVSDVHSLAFCSLKEKALTSPGFSSAYTIGQSDGSKIVFDYGPDCGQIMLLLKSGDAAQNFVSESMQDIVSLMLSSVSDVARANVNNYYAQHCQSPANQSLKSCQTFTQGTSDQLNSIALTSLDQVISTLKTSKLLNNQTQSSNMMYGEGWANAAASYLYHSQGAAKLVKNDMSANVPPSVSDIQSTLGRVVVEVSIKNMPTMPAPSSVVMGNDGETADFSVDTEKLTEYIQSAAGELAGTSVNLASPGETFENLSTKSAYDQEIFATTVPLLVELQKAYIQNMLWEWKNTFVDDLAILTYFPLTAMANFASNMMYFSGMFMLLSTKASIESSYGTALKYYALTASIGVTGILLDSINTMMQNWSRTEQNACWFGPTMFGTMCIEILFVPVNAIVGLILNIIFTVLRVVTFILMQPLISTFAYFLGKAMALRFKYVSLYFAVASPLMALGNFIAIYIPNMPVVIYTLAVMGWLIAVIEAMIGAPLILLGMTSPQGHDVFGSSTQTLMLLFAVFIRPVSLVIAFVLGVISLSVMSLMTSFMMIPFTNSLISDLILSDLPTFASAVIIMMILLMYIYVFMKMIEMTLSMIFRVPYMILRWIGVPLSGISEEAALQSVSGELEKSTGALGSGVGALEGSARKGGTAAGSGGFGG